MDYNIANDHHMDSMDNVNAERPKNVVFGGSEQTFGNKHTASDPSITSHEPNHSSIMADSNRPSSLEDVTSVQLSRTLAVVSVHTIPSLIPR